MGLSGPGPPKPIVTWTVVWTYGLTAGFVGLTGWKLIPEPNPYKAADLLEQTIMEKRKKLGI